MDKETYNNGKKIQRNIENKLEKKAMRTTTKTIHHFETSDRLIIITKEGSEIVGINYIQGSEIDINTPIDNLLTLYVLKRLNYNTARSEQLEQIDSLIWDYVNKGQFIDESKYRINQAIDEMIQENADSGDVSPYEADKLEEYTNKLADLVAQIVLQNR